jgi:hypothetical protein
LARRGFRRGPPCAALSPALPDFPCPPV